MAPALVQRQPGVVAGLSAATKGSGNSMLLYWAGSSGCRVTTPVQSGFSEGVNHQQTTPRLNTIVQEAATSPHANIVQYGTILLWTSGGVVRISGLTSTPTMQTSYAAELDAGGSHTQTPFGANACLVSNPGTTNAKAVARANPTDAGADDSSDFGDGSKVKGAVVLETTNKAYAGFGATVVSFDPSNMASPVDQVASSTDQTDTFLVSPVLLSAAPSRNAWGYAVSTKGQLVAFTRSGAPSSWSAPIRASGPSVLAHPGFSCNTRPNAARGTGILYVGFDDGEVRALVVDGPQLEGIWPKYQRSMGNAGNDDDNPTGLFPTNWPSICPQ